MEVKGTVERKNDRGSILVNGEWYSSYQGKHTGSVNPGDVVSIGYKLSPDGKWKNIQFLNKTGTAPVPAAGTSAPSGGGWQPRNNLGVELGHASNLAMTIAIAVADGEEMIVGGEEFYKLWLDHTNKVYKVMSKLRSLKEKELATPPAAAKDDVLLADDEPF
jgi:hypothetical protein